MSFPRACSCCRRMFSALDWALLPYVGVQFADVPEESLSLRNCRDCHSTLAVPFNDDPATAPTLPPSAVEAWFAKAGEMLS